MSLTPRLDKVDKNYLINGGFDFWQRGTSFATTASVIYSCDRFFTGRDAFATGGTISRQAGVNTTYLARMQRDSGNANTGRIYLIQMVEIDVAKELAGKTVTLSCKLRAGANFSAASNQVRLALVTGTNATQESSSTYFSAGLTGQIRTSATPSITTTLTAYSVTVAIPANATHVAMELSFLPTGTAGAADYVDVSECMMAIANNQQTAKDFARAGINYVDELHLCQRYYEKSYAQNLFPGAVDNTGLERFIGSSVVTLEANAKYRVVKRTTPAVVVYAQNGTINSVTNVTAGTTISASVNLINDSGARVFWASGGTDNMWGFHYTADAEI